MMVSFPRTYRMSPAFLSIPVATFPRSAPDAQHMGKKFLSERESLFTSPVVGHQEPARATFLHTVYPVAGRSVKYLPQEGVHVLMNQPLQ